MPGEMPVKVMVTDNAIIRIHRPILTEDERAKRMAAIKEAARKLAIANRRAEALQQQRLDHQGLNATPSAVV